MSCGVTVVMAVMKEIAEKAENEWVVQRPILNAIS